MACRYSNSMDDLTDSIDKTLDKTVPAKTEDKSVSIQDRRLGLLWSLGANALDLATYVMLVLDAASKIDLPLWGMFGPLAIGLFLHAKAHKLDPEFRKGPATAALKISMKEGIAWLVVIGLKIAGVVEAGWLMAIIGYPLLWWVCKLAAVVLGMPIQIIMNTVVSRQNSSGEMDGSQQAD